MRSGELPAIKIGGRGVWRIDKHELDKYLDHLIEQTAEWAKKHPLNPRGPNRSGDEVPEEVSS